MDAGAAMLEKTRYPGEALTFLEPLAKATPWDASFHLRLAKAQIAANQDKAGAADAMGKMAMALENPYGLRVQAASALPGLALPRDFGSKELALVAAGPNTFTPADADRPFFYDARLAAAQSVSTAQAKLQLLGKALADLASRSDARLSFFRSAASLQQDDLALASIAQLLRTIAVSRASQENATDEDVLAPTQGAN